MAARIRAGIESDSGEYGLQDDALADLDSLLALLKQRTEERDHFSMVAQDYMSASIRHEAFARRYEEALREIAERRMPTTHGAGIHAARSIARAVLEGGDE